MPDKFLNRYRIPSARLSTWDHSSNAAYFITICTANRQHYFGKIENSEMQLSKIGEYALACWMNIPDHFPFFYLDESVVMPNHLHGIVLIDNPCFVETRHAWSLRHTPNEQPARHFRFRNQGKNTISAMVGSFKSAVTKFCNENSLCFGWQARFHDHIIRNREEFYRIRNYITNNVSNWKEDRFLFGFVETRHALSLRHTPHEPQPRHFRFRSAMVGSFKSAVTKFCNENNLTFGWQSRFHDHIIRDKKEFYQIRNYITDNVINWKDDRFYSIS